ncbi:prolipoprotein diacylglyceryl transferase [Paenibacillus humicus]|uniref:prolipoprotein diacylglyceryl transferase n=1 Tax=Paenibacillus humicus TaxID=412861 RepID=UPI003F163C43
MYNDILKIGSITIRGYGLMIAIGVLLAFLLASKRAHKKNLNPDTMYTLGIIALVFGFIGAKILFVIVEFKKILEDPSQIFSGSGFVVYGGIVGGALATIIYCKIKKIDFLPYFDLVAPSLALAQGFGRIGCLLAGCCYGRETTSMIGIVFQNSTLAPNGVKLFPTQIMSSVGDFLLAFILLIYARSEKSPGKVGALYIMLYSIGRFVIEFFRNDARGSVGLLSTSQFIALLMLALGFMLFNRDKLPWSMKRT